MDQDAKNDVKRLKAAIENADAVIIGAGAGLSTAAGFTYTGERFEKYFGDFARKYGFRDMYSGGFYPYPSAEEFWAFWSRYIMINRYQDPPKPVYGSLLERVCDKDYFVITTNVDHCFQKAGFDKHRLFYTQGDYGLFQCSVPCRQVVYENEDMVREMYNRQKDMRIPSELIPTCPNCGKPLTTNLRADDKFVEDDGWHRAAERYELFLRRHTKTRTLFLEIGTGYNTPVIIKYPFWRMTNSWPEATYACINLGEAIAPKEIESKSILINADAAEVIEALK